MKRPIAAMILIASGLGPCPQAQAQGQAAVDRPYQVEWVYRVQYGSEDEWWRIFRKYQIAILDREKQLGYVKEYVVQRPGLHTDEHVRWDYRVIITYATGPVQPTKAKSRNSSSRTRQPMTPRNGAAGS